MKDEFELTKFGFSSDQGCQIEPISAFLADLNFLADYSPKADFSRFYIFILMIQPLRVKT